MAETFSCHKVSEGVIEGEVLVSSDDLCFYLVDPESGKVIEKNHALEGQSVADKILIFPSGKGSSVVQADGMYQLKMAGKGPKALIIRYPDTVLVASSIIMELPVVDKVDEAFYEKIKTGDNVLLDADTGKLTIQ
ncbi:MAG: aconitase X swivel domain-containing protein [Sporolactobacillus sp.]